MDGYKTWTGIIASALGLLGLGYLISADNIGVIIDAVLKIGGIALSVYGNYVAHQKIATLQGV